MAHRPPPPSKPIPASSATELVYGVRAARAVLDVRPSDAIELEVDRARERDLEALVARARELRVPVRATDEHALQKLTRTHNHEGASLRTRPRTWTPTRTLADRLASGRGAVIALDRVRNAYNIGAILRSAAFFGIDAALFGSRAPDPDLPEDAVRVAEGGAERLVLSRTTDLADTLSRLRTAGVQIVAAESDGSSDAIGFAFAERSVLVLGHEREGISDRVRAQCDAVVAIRGSGHVESLNVAIAASLMISELVRGRAPAARPTIAAPRAPTAQRPSEPRPSRDHRPPRRR
ncbi:MAG: RNA methyltransferase [Myxococcales bacterium]|nr:RNA methyltransferase [Myxococcales bacterium]